MPETQTKELVEGEILAISKNSKKKRDKRGSGSVSNANDLNSSIIANDPPHSCKVCNKLIEIGRSIRCDKCAYWIHFECTNLTKTDYGFLEKPSLPASIKWFCPRCESDTDNPNKNADDKFDRLATLVLSVAQQNTEILNQIKTDKKMEETKQKNFEKAIKTNVVEVLDDRKHKEDRQNNSVMFNIPENADNDEGKLADVKHVKEVIKFVCPEVNTDDLSVKNVTRLGERKAITKDNPSPRPRPIKIAFSEPSPRDSLLKNARKLKDSPQVCRHICR